MKHTSWKKILMFFGYDWVEIPSKTMILLVYEERKLMCAYFLRKSKDLFAN